MGQDFKAVNDVLATKKQHLDEAYRRISKFNRHWKASLATRKEREDKLMLQISKLEAQVKDSEKRFDEETARRYAAEGQLNKALANLKERKLTFESKKRKLEDCFGEGAWEDSVEGLQYTIMQRELLVEGLLTRPDHPETKGLLEEFRARGRA